LFPRYRLNPALLVPVTLEFLIIKKIEYFKSRNYSLLTMKQKIKLIFIPFLIVAICCVTVYTFLNWLLIIRWQVLNVKEEVVQIWAPIIFAFIALFIWIRPRLKLLEKRKKGDFNTLFLMMGVFAISVPTIIAQMYLVTATGKLTSLPGIHELNSEALTKFYTLKNHYVEKGNPGIYYTSDVSGKYGNDLNLHIYIACPLYDSVEELPDHALKTAGEEDTVYNKDSLLYIVDGVRINKDELMRISPYGVQSISVEKGRAAMALYGDSSVKGAILITTKTGHYHRSFERPRINLMQYPPKAWLCVYYQKTIRNHQSRDKKEIEFHEFYNESLEAFNNRNLDSFSYLQLAGNNNHRDGYVAAIKKLNNGEGSGKPVILEPEFNSFAQRNGNKFSWILGSFAIGATVLFLILLIPKLKEDALQGVLPTKRGAATGNIDILRYFLPRKGYYITPIIIDCNILVFLLLVLSGSGFISLNIQSLLTWGANYRPYTVNGQWWRLVTSIFLHGGVMHILANMYALLIVGILLEPVMGKNRYAISYMVTGILGSITSLWWHTATVSVGASGAIFGLYGIFLALLLTKVFSKDISKAFLAATIIFIVYNLLMGFSGGIDNAAHIGGLTSGVVIGLILSPQLKQEQEDKKAMLAIETSSL